MIFGFGRKKDQTAAQRPTAADDGSSSQAAPPMDLRRDGVEFSDVSDQQLEEAAVAAGRLEWFWLTSPRFGGIEMPLNRLAGPVGVAAVREWIDDRAEAVIERGGEVSADVDVHYDDDSGSRVPRSVVYNYGEAGTYTLTFW